ncbi:hypothetical protein ARALYDRAFT_311464 [Arabidopsis lyrata subsp. lyrata]|uniref:Peptidase C1A papain C-terminal domain-containing protein n=1 Tax=Arabidopsis lyrata subsp. lyrata TaxID=81972 RepID=D7KCH8_ARALL|nr:hypothetical protein ARALYDRAFT_311464 [Arabidopsis lyrata subsp. lyrata]
MGKSESSIGGKPKTPKGPNELKLEAAAARKKGPNITPVTQSDDGVRSKPCYLNCNIEICWAIALTRLLQAIYNITRDNITNRKSFLHDDLVVHLKTKKNPGKRPASLKLQNLKDAIKHIAVNGLLKIKATGVTKAGSEIGYHGKWNFSMEKCPSVDFIKSKVDISPVVISFDIADEFHFIGNVKGIYKVSGVDMEDGEVEGHAVLIVGYGYTKDNRLFFLIQNSWGEDWGVKGFGRIFIDDISTTTLVYPNI